MEYWKGDGIYRPMSFDREKYEEGEVKNARYLKEKGEKLKPKQWLRSDICGRAKIFHLFMGGGRKNMVFGQIKGDKF